MHHTASRGPVACPPSSHLPSRSPSHRKINVAGGRQVCCFYMKPTVPYSPSIVLWCMTKLPICQTLNSSQDNLFSTHSQSFSFCTTATENSFMNFPSGGNGEDRRKKPTPPQPASPESQPSFIREEVMQLLRFPSYYTESHFAPKPSLWSATFKCFSVCIKSLPMLSKWKSGSALLLTDLTFRARRSQLKGLGIQKPSALLDDLQQILMQSPEASRF